MKIKTKKLQGNGEECKLNETNAIIIIENKLFNRFENGMENKGTGYYPYEYVNYTKKMKFNRKKMFDNIFFIKDNTFKYNFYINLSLIESFKLKWMNGDHWSQKISTWGFIVAVITSILLTIQTCNQVKTNNKTIKIIEKNEK